jgi:hypothetical protein
LKIIEFLMNNIFIVVIIFGALASLFGKAGSKKKPRQMPDFGGGGLPRSLFPQASEREPSEDRPLQERTEGQSVFRSQSEQERQQSANPSYSSRDSETLSGAPQIASLQRSLERASASKVVAPAAAERKSAGQSAIAATVQADDLRKAVIWAEILGPPRAKRPFRK